jgi:uncharacterized membrane protein
MLNMLVIFVLQRDRLCAKGLWRERIKALSYACVLRAMPAPRYIFGRHDRVAMRGLERIPMTKFALVAYISCLLVMSILDGVWLGFIARDFYKAELGDLAAAEIRKIPAALFYFGYPAGIVALALHPAPDSWVNAAWRCAVVGLVAYGTYDLTNMATLRHWSVKLAAVDTAWGVVASGIAGTVAYVVAKRFAL